MSEGIIGVENKTLMEEIREEASRRIIQKEGYRGITEFLDALAEEGLVVWLEFFPRICAEIRRVNRAAQKLAFDVGSKGKFTDTYGWSPDGSFRLAYEYTPEFYFFMRNYVYTDFFSDTKVRPTFMKRIMRGDDPMETLLWAKKKYGSNSQRTPVVHGGQLGSDS